MDVAFAVSRGYAAARLLGRTVAFLPPSSGATVEAVRRLVDDGHAVTEVEVWGQRFVRVTWGG